MNEYLMLFIYREVLSPQISLNTLIDQSTANREEKRITVMYSIEVVMDHSVIQRGPLGRLLIDPSCK